MTLQIKLSRRAKELILDNAHESTNPFTKVHNLTLLRYDQLRVTHDELAFSFKGEQVAALSLKEVERGQELTLRGIEGTIACTHFNP